ncbi:Calcium-dependent channel [Trypanosoma melophagium]|uniref:Calcium-dependent channel n=1 Tax=Trypanosoma melophagium TaxID=715481 RepID=UPI00351A816F|nr:Calcium-dependent channel [Trypanosoma melophagium]
MDVSLGPRATWDDQGLWFALVFNSIVCTILVCVTIFFRHSPILWIRRRYRANHTVVLQLTSLSVSSDENADSPNRSATGAGLSSSSAFRISRVGRALRYPSTLTNLPKWRCWLSIEEKLEHIENVFPSSVARFPFTKDETSCSSGDESLFEDVYDGNDPYVEVRATYSPETPEGEGIAPATEKEEGGGREKRVKEGKATCSLQYSAEEMDIKSLTKVPLNPQIALYLSFLKLFATIFLAGGIFNIWICAISGTDDYLERYTVSRDIHSCHLQDDNESGCIDKKPFCQYINGTVCFPVPLRGLYDLSAQNIAPQSWRFWLVAFIDMAFGIVYLISMLYYLCHVDKYISTVLRIQMESALGHRVALVRSLKGSWANDTVFREQFLAESAYFGRSKKKNEGTPPKGVSGNDNAMDLTSLHNAYSRNPKDVDYDDFEYDDSKVYHYLQCTGLSCLFSIFSVNYYKTSRKDAVFTRYGKVQQLLFPRDVPKGMHKYIDNTEEAMEALQEAVADMKNYQLQQEQEGNHQHHHAKVLMMRAPFPSCCTKVPRVEYWRKSFVENATQLNKCIDAVSSGDVKGYAFVIFADALSAYEFVNLFEARNQGSSHSQATIAGPPEGIIQINVTADRYTGWLRTILVLGAYVSLIIFWSVPVGFLGSLDNIARIPGLGGPIYEFYLSIPEGIRSVITAFLPVLLLYLLNALLPFIIKWFIIFMGAVNQDELNSGMLYLQYIFMLLTGVIFQAALQGGLFQFADLVTNPSSAAIVNFFVAMVSPQGGYWYANVITSAFVNTWLAIVDPVTLFLIFCRHRLVSLQRVYDRLFKPSNFNWATLYSADLTILAMGLLFHMTVPLLAAFVGLYLLIRYATQRARLMDSHRPSEHPRRDGSAAGLAASAQVLRAAASLHAVGGVGGVLFMSLRRHVGGVVVCSITLAASILLMCYVFAVSRRWVASLANARRLLTHGEEETFGLGEYVATALDKMRERKGKVGGKATDVVMEKSSMRELSKRLTTDKQRSGNSDNNDNNNNNNNSNNNKGKKDRHFREISAYGDNSDDDDKEKRERKGEGGEEEEEADVDEFTTRDASDNRSTIRRPSTELLPRNSHIFSKYHPKHQQLVHINIDEEINRIEETVYRVERYWDVPFEFLSEDVKYTGTKPPILPPSRAAVAVAAADPQ